MKRPAVLSSLLLACALALGAASPGELFQKAKAQFAGGSYAEALATLGELETESQKPENEGSRAPLTPALAFYRGACLAELGKAAEAQSEFAVFLSLQPNAGIDRAAFPKKTFAAFESARKASAKASDFTPVASIFTAYQEFKPPANISEPVNEGWGNTAVKWIMTAGEKKEWAQLSSGSERAEFIEKFWNARDPHTGSAENTFRTSFERRVAFADANFPQDEKQRGSLTDRGMVFVLLGPPTYIGRKPLTTAEDTSSAAGMSTVSSNDINTAVNSMNAGGSKPSTSGRAAMVDRMSGPTSTALGSEANWREIWHYRKELLPPGIPYLQVDIEFITKKGYGQNVMQRSEMRVLSTIEAAKKAPKA